MSGFACPNCHEGYSPLSALYCYNCTSPLPPRPNEEKLGPGAYPPPVLHTSKGTPKLGVAGIAVGAVCGVLGLLISLSARDVHYTVEKRNSDGSPVFQMGKDGKPTNKVLKDVVKKEFPPILLVGLFLASGGCVLGMTLSLMHKNQVDVSQGDLTDRGMSGIGVTVAFVCLLATVFVRVARGAEEKPADVPAAAPTEEASTE